MGGRTGGGEDVFNRLVRTEELQLAGIYGTGEEVLRDIPSQAPDVALVDFNLPCMDGFECVIKLKARLPELPVLMFSTDVMAAHLKQEALIFSAFHAGASGYLPRHLPPAEWLEAIALARQEMRRRVFLMFFDSDNQMGRLARHWGKIAAMLDSPKVTIHYSEDWRRIAISSKAGQQNFRLDSNATVPPAGITHGALAPVLPG